MTVTLSEAGNKGSIEVDYTDNCNASSGSVTIAKGNTSATISIDTSTLTAPTSCTVTLDSANGNTGQNVGTISPDTSTITVTSSTSSDSDLKITKTGSAEVVTVNRWFYYTIDVKNEGTDTATNVEVVDTLPTEITEVDEVLTNQDSDTVWTCDANTTTSPITVTCLHDDSNISSGETHSIILYVRAPLESGTIENDVTVTNQTDTNSTTVSSSAHEVTTITNDVDNAENLCYSVEPTTDADCLKRGNFYYGNGCTTLVTISDNNESNQSLEDLVVTKMYAPELDRGIATTSVGTIRSTGATSGGPSPIAITEYTSYTEGYVVDVGNSLANDANFTLTDVNSYNNGNKMYGIALYADYNISITNTAGDTGNEHHSGRIYACGGGGEGGIEITTSADVIDTPIGTSATLAGYYNSSTDTSNNGTNIKYIKTMVASDQAREIEGVHLDLGGFATTYEFNGTSYSDYVVIPYLTDDSCTVVFENIIDPNTNEQLVIEIPEGSYSATGTMIVPSYVMDAVRMQLIFVDPNGLSVEGQQCLANSSTTGNFARLAQCVNSEVQYKTAFGQDAWDRCGLDSGKPCIPANHGDADEYDPTYDPAIDHIYNNELGCYLCTFNIRPVCSSDNFAIRPRKFDVNITDKVTILTAGKPESLFFRAPDDNNVTPVTDYNETQDSSFVVDLDINDSTKACEKMSITMTPSVAFVNGEHQDDFTFDDVGDINMSIHEINGSEFALIDWDDTNDSERFIEEYNATFRVIPDRFDINASLKDHNTNDHFTYLHDINRYENDSNYSMGAELNVTIKAVGADGNVTHNYIETCYAKDTNLALGLTGTTITYPGTTQALSFFLYYNPEEDDGTADSGESNVSLTASGNTITLNRLDINNTKASFTSQTAPDENGTTNILYKMNFDRNMSLVVDPFRITVSDINITEVNVTDFSGTGTLVPNQYVVKGQTGTLTDQNATFYFGRAKPSKYFYEDITTDWTYTPITATVYCDSLVNCSNFGINILLAGTDERNWYIVRGHNANIGDGNVTIQIGATLIEPEGTATSSTDQAINGFTRSSGDANVLIISNGVRGDVNVSRGSSPLPPLTVPLELVTENDVTGILPFTNRWLIYTKDPNGILILPNPFYKVRFITESKWTGEGKTGYVIDTNASYKKSKRLDW
ncbi:DUF11 domain-containing protein [Sulfurovum riftiae]|uniref:DUF11 domain-containing protein n=1 Tax=Sulfurovum riftiae TaxID=1630136 RepID=UPI00137B1D01|nr:DUF11 domain-containing protein [Sulfurovum riftiae]